MHTSFLKVLTIITCLITFSNSVFAQFSDKEIERNFKKASLFNTRGTNIFDIAIGSAVPNNDFANPQFEVYFKAGYKRYITPHLYVGLDYHKFNLANSNLPNNGFMSFDFNAFFTLMPYKKLTPFLFFGTGLTASNYFDESSQKIQFGIGIEYMLVEFLGLTLHSDYNYQFDDSLDGLEFGDSNDTFFRMAIGVNFYFGGKQKHEKLMKNIPTVINSNRIDNQ
jgi:curli production assembly/transport component CsgG